MQTLNSPLEVGMRVLAVLDARFPEALTLSELVVLDHAIVHSADVGGPQSLHPAVPTRASEIFLKRTIVEQALRLLVQTQLASVAADTAGILFRASENARSFLDLFDSTYMSEVRTRAQWALGLDALEPTTDVRSLIASWALEFEGRNHQAGEIA